MPTILLATDLDDTLVGNDAALRRFNTLVTRLRDEQKVKLVYVTGRSPELFEELKAEWPLLEPDALIAAVGTEIYSNKNKKVTNWPVTLNWDPEAIKARLAHIPALELQPPDGQRQYKVGYFLKDPRVLYDVKKALKEYLAEVVYCQGLFLDILPKGAHKGGAVRYLSAMWHIDASKIIACGDSGNDISMLSTSKAVVVGNAKSELLDWVNEVRPKNVYVATASHADGILEGLRHYQVIRPSRGNRPCVR